jgi:hypothetical protein
LLPPWPPPRSMMPSPSAALPTSYRGNREKRRKRNRKRGTYLTGVEVPTTCPRRVLHHAPTLRMPLLHLACWRSGEKEEETPHTRAGFLCSIELQLGATSGSHMSVAQPHFALLQRIFFPC